MEATQVLDTEVVEPDPSTSTAVIPVVPAAPTLAVTPQVEAKELVERLAVIREAMDTAMIRDVDYGVIPGTDKPTLYKPGSEKLGVLFQLDVQLTNEKTWGPGEHLTVISHATVFHAPTGARLGYGEGICSTREKKYGKRKQERLCPACNAPAVIKGKEEYGGGWLCWAKRNGCGAKFDDGDAAIESQETGEVENPDLPDLWNTIDKMASKRARIDAVLAVTGASALFTQDMDDNVERAPANGNGNGKQPAPAARQRTEAPKTTAQPAQQSERPITANQKGAINGRCSQAGLSEDQVKAILNWVGGSAVLDRLSSKTASKLIGDLDKDGSGAEQILEDIRLAAEGGDDRAQKISARFLGEAASA
jgi:hypothetical protein